MKIIQITGHAARVLAVSAGVIGCAGGVPAVAARPATSHAVGATRIPAGAPLVLPTNAQVIAAVAQAVDVQKLPAGPPTLALPTFGCMVFYTATTSPACVYGDPQGSHSLVLYGDSHAANWIAAFDAIGKYLHWKVIEITKAQCQAPDFPVWLQQLKRPYVECDAFRRFALTRIAQLHPDLVVVASQGDGPYLYANGGPTRHGLEAAWANGLARVIDAIKPVAGKVIVLGDFAYGRPAGSDCLPAHADDIRVCNLLRSRAVNDAHDQMEQRVAQQHGAQYAATVQWFCTASVCPAVIAGISTRNDGFHVSPYYALWLSDALATALGLLPAS